MAKKFNSKYYLKKEIDYLLIKMYQIKVSFEIFKDLKSGEEKKFITDNIPFFSQTILTALSQNIFLELSKIIVDTPDFRGEENICLSNLIKKYNNNKSLFKLKKYYYARNVDNNKRVRINLPNTNINGIISNLSKKINVKNKIYNYLRKLRHKELAHNDKAFGFKTRKKFIKGIVTYKEIEDYINELYNDLNELYRSIFSTSVAFRYEHKDELKWLTKIIKDYNSNN